MKRVISSISLSVVLALRIGSGFGEGEAARFQEPDSSEGARLFTSACTLCHDVAGITENPGVYSEEAFRELVAAMVDYGAPLDDLEAEELVQYLTVTYGKGSP